MWNLKLLMAKNKCYNCYQKELQIDIKLWEEEQRRKIGPDWVGFSTRKEILFKRPISRTLCSSSLAAGGGGPRPDAITPREAAKGVNFISFSFLNYSSVHF